MSGSLRASVTALAGSVRFVEDAFLQAPSVPFVPENVKLGDYTFLPWVRSGLAAALEEPVPGALRATVRVDVTVKDEAGGSAPAGRTLTLRGPGDVLGLDPAQIIRRVPEEGTADAEESFLAHVEFDRPELPWLFTPLRPQGDRLQPWLALVVCDVARARLEPGPAGLPGRLRTALGELQPLDDAWAWAHAQVAGNLEAGAPPVGDRLSEAHAPVNLSRLLCPRRLAPRRRWLACLVPSFDCGARAGLGLPGGTLGPAWSRAADGGDAGAEVVLPCYYAWRFATAPAGDFEQLAKRLHGVPAPWKVGRRLVDAGDPGSGIPALPEGAPGGVQVLRCALVSPSPPPPEAPPEGVGWEPPMRDALRAVVDAAADVPETADLPRVGPRLYARFQRGQPRLGAVFGDPPADAVAADADWFSALNTTPTHRIVAGLGTRVVRRDQEELMQAAWMQVGEIRKANATLARIQFGRFVGEALHRRHLGRLGLGELAQVLRGVQGKIRVGATALTVHGAVADSAVPPAAMSPAFRRATRLRGPVARRAGAADLAPLRSLLASGEAFRDLRRAYVEPEGVRGLSVEAIQALPVATLARALGVPEAAAQATAAQRLAVRPGAVAVADRLAAPVSGWRLPAGSIDLGARAAERLAGLLEVALPERLAGDAVRVEAMAPLLAGLASGGVAGVADRAEQAMTRIEARLPAPDLGGVVTPGPQQPGRDPGGGGLGGVVVPRPDLGEVFIPGRNPGGVVLPGRDPGGMVVPGARVPPVVLRGGGLAGRIVERRADTAPERRLAPTGRALPAGGAAVGGLAGVRTTPGAAAAAVTGGSARGGVDDAIRTGPGRGQVVTDVTGGPDRGVGDAVLTGPGGRPVVTDVTGGVGGIADGPRVDAIPRLRFERSVSREVTASVAASRAVPFATLATELSRLVAGLGAAGLLPLLPERPALALARPALLQAVAPARTATAYAQARIRIRPSWLPGDWFADGLVNPIMAAPRFDRPMYEALDAYDRDWLVPGLGAVAATDFVTLLTTNPAFTEAFLVGLSDEMGRELLWRDYPTDQRGTYFRRFWDEAEDELTTDIHRFPPRTPLGRHLKAEAGGAEARVVIAIRGELVRRHPDALVLALQAPGRDAQGRPVFAAPSNAPGAAGRVLFRATLLPDILLVGFDLTVAQLRAESGNWWFVIAEHPTAPRFGLDLPPEEASRAGLRRVQLDGLDWTSFGALAQGLFLSPGASGRAVANAGGAPASLAWGTDAAATARLLLQSPVRAAFDARRLLAPALGS